MKTVVAAHHAAIQARNITQIASLWLQGPDITLINPRDTSIAVGWDAVKSRWEQVFDVVSGFEITQVDGPHINVLGDVAWSIGTVHVVTHFKTQGTKLVDLVETDVMVKRDEHWLLVSHTARPL